MFDKIQSLNMIKNLSLNIHNFYIPNSYQEYKDIIKQLEFCTIRTDHEVITEDLPFYIFDSRIDNINKLNQIWNDSQLNNYKLIISDGIKYDNIQDYNMVVKIQKNGDFIFEVSELKIPLRHMYRYSLLSCTGNIGDNIHQWSIHKQKYGLNKANIKDDLLTIYNYQIFDKWLEITKYPIGIGIKNSRLVFWQIK